MGRKQLVGLVVLVFIISCARKPYFNKDFKEVSKTHTKIAVLPFQIENLRIELGNLTQEEEIFVDSLEGLAFQQAAYNSLLENYSANNKTLVTLQPLEITNQKLKNAGYISDSVGAYYCKLLGVDAVIICRVAKERLYTNLSALGVKLPNTIYKKLKADSTDLNDNMPQIPGNAERTYSLKSLFSITDTRNKLLWQYENDLETNWSANEVETIRRLTQRLAKNFPYNTKTVIN